MKDVRIRMVTRSLTLVPKIYFLGREFFYSLGNYILDKSVDKYV
ncbi:hypothetical protein CFB3_43780 [Clostridium folliculivorans]|nr:hypothetical protein CFB3_43780 [Clostridium folliculivorans]